jgi:periplasmic copper chaperone A
MLKTIICTGAFVLVLASTASYAQHMHTAPAPAAKGQVELKKGDLTITAPWSRATPNGAKVAGGYVRIINRGTMPDRLIGGSFEGAARVEVHEMSVTGGIMRMRELEKGLEIAPGAMVELKPGGFHLMFMEMGRSLREGEIVKGTLVFEKAGTIEVEFRVGSLGAQGATSHAH